MSIEKSEKMGEARTAFFGIFDKRQTMSRGCCHRQQPRLGSYHGMLFGRGIYIGLDSKLQEPLHGGAGGGAVYVNHITAINTETI